MILPENPITFILLWLTVGVLLTVILQWLDYIDGENYKFTVRDFAPAAVTTVLWMLTALMIMEKLCKMVDSKLGDKVLISKKKENWIKK